MTICTYLQQHLEKIEQINEIDALIFNKLTYIPFESFISKDEKITIWEAYQRIKQSFLFNKEEEEFFSLLSQNNRYKDLYIQSIINKIDYEEEEQFMAMTILLSDESIYVAYRGTTEELVAWKEDFNMSYMTVPAQKDAIKYLNQFNKVEKIYIGGHSKGGNLAMYAAINAKEEVKKNIIRVFDYDGPGFISLDSNYESFKNKIISYLPSDSIVGRLFKKTHKIIVIKSDYRGLRQHDLSFWHIKNNSLVLSNLSKESNFIKKAIDLFFETIDEKKWILFVNTTYRLLVKMNITSIKQLHFSDIKNIIESDESIERGGKQLLTAIIKYLLHMEKANDML